MNVTTYQELLIDEGQGIPDEYLKAERQDNLSICIGLGGTGKDAVRRLKKAVYKNLKSDVPDSPVPIYGNIKFLVVDSDSAYMDSHNVYDINPDTEYFNISFPDIAAMFHVKDIIKARKELSWLNYKHLPVYNYNCGTGAIRQVGRFCLIDKAQEFKTRLTSLIQETAKDFRHKITIHIFSGLSGGTGGGIFIDACYMIRCVLEELGQENALINGYFFLPDVNLSNPATEKSSFIANHLKGNGYAALKELDYLMNLEQNHDRFVQNYGSFKIDTSRAPVDCCNLISCIGHNGTAVDNGYDYAISTAVDHVISLLIKNDGSTDSLRSFLLPEVPTQKKRNCGAVFKYNFIGITHAEVPIVEIITYLGTRLFLQFHHLFNHTPSPEDLENFVSENNLTFECLLRQLAEGISYNLSYPKSLKGEKDIIPNDKRVIGCADDWMSMTYQTLEKNCKSMADYLKNYNIPLQSGSVITRIFSALYAIALDPSKGPVFAAKLLGGPASENLQYVIDRYIYENEELLNKELCQESLRKQELDTAKENLIKANFLNRRTRINDYLESVKRWYIHLAIIEQHNVMRTLLKTLRDHAYKLYNEFFHPLSTVLETLDNTFRKNDSIYQNLQSYETLKETLSRQIPDLGNLQKHLDNVISGVNPAVETQNLVRHLLNNWHRWVREDENDITWLISRYITQKFPHIIRHDMTHWIKYASKSPSDVIRELITQASQPMLWENPDFSFDGIEKVNQLLVPAPYLSISVSAVSAVGAPYKVISKRMDNRITAIKMYRGLPLCAWKGLAELESAYENSLSVPGRHLYEAGTVDWREYLPSPCPPAFNSGAPGISRIRERNERLTKELEEAKHAGIVCCDFERWHIKRALTADLSSLSAEAQDHQPDGRPDMLKFNDSINHFREMRMEMYADDNVEEITLSAADAAKGFEERVLLDDYLRCPVLQTIVREELAKIHALDKEISKLEDTWCCGVCTPVRPNRAGDFFNAVFTGVIRHRKDKIFFSCQPFNMEEVLELQNTSMSAFSYSDFK